MKDFLSRGSGVKSFNKTEETLKSRTHPRETLVATTYNAIDCALHIIKGVLGFSEVVIFEPRVTGEGIQILVVIG